MSEMTSDFMQEFIKGSKGANQGLPTGIDALNRALNGVQRASIYGVAAAPKVGKSTFVDFAFMINPYLYAIENDIDLEIKYYSLEMPGMWIKYKIATHFFYRDYGIATFENNTPVEGTTIVPITPNYLLHKLKDDNDEMVKVKDEHLKILNEIEKNRIIPMFGLQVKGKTIRRGRIEIIEDRADSNPTGIRNYLHKYAEANGKFLYEEYTTKDAGGSTIERKRINGYKPNNPDKYVIVILDHLRKMKIESRNKMRFTIKQNMDKMLEYQVFLRNICEFTFVNIVHLNRNISDLQRIRYIGENLYPNNSDIKDSGNLSEEADYLLTLFDPNDDRYNLSRHFGVDISENDKYRSVHLVESRDTICPRHIQVDMYANLSHFEQI